MTIGALLDVLLELEHIPGTAGIFNAQVPGILVAVKEESHGLIIFPLPGRSRLKWAFLPGEGPVDGRGKIIKCRVSVDLGGRRIIKKKKHLDLPDVGVLEEHGGIGMAEKVRVDMLLESDTADGGHGGLDSAAAKESPPSFTREKVGLGSKLLSLCRVSGKVGEHWLCGHIGNRHVPADPGFSGGCPDEDLPGLAILKLDVGEAETCELPHPQTTVHKNGQHGLLLRAEIGKGLFKLGEVFLWQDLDHELSLIDEPTFIPVRKPCQWESFPESEKLPSERKNAKQRPSNAKKAQIQKLRKGGGPTTQLNR